MIIGVTGYANATCIGKAFDPCCNIDTLAIDTFPILHHITDVHPNPELKSLVLNELCILLRQFLLYLGSTL